MYISLLRLLFDDFQAFSVNKIENCVEEHWREISVIG